MFPKLSSVMPTPELISALPAADVWWPTWRNWRLWQFCGIAGDWTAPAPGGNRQIVAIPRHLGVRPEQLGFGPGWYQWMVFDDRAWVFYSRVVNDRNGIDVFRYERLPPNVQLDGSLYRYQGLPRWR